MSDFAVCRHCGGDRFVNQATVTAFYRAEAEFASDGTLAVVYADTDYSDDFEPGDDQGWYCEGCDAQAATLEELVRKVA